MALGAVADDMDFASVDLPGLQVVPMVPKQRPVPALLRRPLSAAHLSGPFGLEPLDPAVDGPGAPQLQSPDRRPGVTVVPEPEDGGAEADLGLGVRARAVE